MGMRGQIDIVRYQRAKTGALFAACTMAGAASSGYEPQAWQKLGFAIGEAFQVADDLRDVAGSAESSASPCTRTRQPATEFRGRTWLRRRHGAFRGPPGRGHGGHPRLPGANSWPADHRRLAQPRHRPLLAHRRRLIQWGCRSSLRPLGGGANRLLPLPPSRNLPSPFRRSGRLAAALPPAFRPAGGLSYSQILYATVKLGLIDMLSERPLTLSALAARLGGRRSAWNACSRPRLAEASRSATAGTTDAGIHGAALPAIRGSPGS